MFWRSTVPRLVDTRVLPQVSVRLSRAQLHNTSFLNSGGSLFGDITNAPKQPESTVSSTTDSETGSKVPENAQQDKELQEFRRENALKEQISIDKYVTPLKQKLFNLNVKANGFFKNNQVIHDPETGKMFKLTLKEKEIEYLEPSIYLQSLRIKSSVKKATLVNRFVRGYNVKTAINQLHFNPKKMATELEKLLKDGLTQARTQGLNEDGLYIDQVWAGSDGGTTKRADAKGRGRTGVLRHRYAHVKAVLKTEQTLQRLKWEKEQAVLESKPKMNLNNEPLNFRVKPFYKW
ncbi:54S ribosomal protein L22, mitochondrial [[Candida] anglica]|uniref:54S ribosomal protein L22, mitochondrial n=1 Tax=[Candida] anglica TaxID=148631 RepID=A0ABP0E5E3_9ASCO